MSRIENQSKKIASVQRIFSSIEKSCNTLHSKSAKLNLNENSEIVSLLAKTCDIDMNHAQDIAMATLGLLVSDCQNFLRQKDLFDFTDSSNYRSSQFIWEIWNGDAYGTKEIDALEEFLSEINSSIDIVGNTEKFVERCQTEYINMLKK